MNPGDEEVSSTADKIYRELSEKGIEVLYDDRDERAGVKFNDADLIGIPLRVTIGKRGLKEGNVEIRVRATGEESKVPIEGVLAAVEDFLSSKQS